MTLSKMKKDELVAECKRLRNTIDGLTINVQDKDAAIANFKSKIEELDKSHASKKQEINTLMEEIKELKDNSIKDAKELQNARDKIVNLSNDVRGTEQRVKDLETKCDVYKRVITGLAIVLLVSLVALFL